MEDLDGWMKYFEVAGQAAAAPNGNAKVALWEEAVRIADTFRDDETAYDARMELTNAAQFSGRPDVSFVSFSWCLAYCDRHADDTDPTMILWHYKWMADTLPNFPDAPRSQIEGLFADITARFRAQGSTLHAVHQIRRDVAITMGDRAVAEAAHGKFLLTRRDPLSNCKACVQDADVSYQLFLGDDAAAIAAAKPILRGKMSCGEVPERTYAKLLLPYLRRGDPTEAMRWHKVGYPPVQSNPAYISSHGSHAAFLALTGNLGRAARLLSRHLPMAVQSVQPEDCFRFYNAAKLALELILDAPRPPKVKVPPEVHAGGEVEALAIWLDNELYTLAARFDARNGNSGYADDIATMQANRALATKFPYAAE